MQTNDSLQNWAAGLDRRMYAALIGIALGLIGGLVGLSMVLLGPVITFGVFIGAMAAVYVLTVSYTHLTLPTNREV